MTKKQKTNLKKKLVSVFYFTTVVFLSCVLISLLLFIYFAKDLPRPERYDDRPIDKPTKIYDRSGENVLYSIYGEEKREVIELSSLPDHFTDALLTAEDANFYEHFGIDLQGITRSVLLNFQARRAVAGGSTISQQFVRSALLTTERRVIRKVREIILTLELERRYEKDEILEFYLNQIPFGSNAYGVESASQTYFNKQSSELTIAESATLVSLIPAPSHLSPFGNNVEELLRRKNNLLDRMFSRGLITKEEYEGAKEENIVFHLSRDYLRAPHFVMHIKNTLNKKYGEDFLEEKGLQVYTTIDFELQKRAEEIIKEKVASNYHYNAHNATMVVNDPHTGEILAMVGSADYFKEPYPEGCTPGVNCQFDPFTNVTTRNRQPGSAFKPFVYATAFQKGYDDKTVVEDEKTNFGTSANPYIPRNYDGIFRGEVTLRESLAQSLNVPSVKVLKEYAGLEESIKNARDFGIELPRPASFYGLPLVLGGGDVKLLEIASAYGVFATNGYRNPPVFISKIEDEDGVIIEKSENSPRRVLNRDVAKKITDILSDNNARAPVFGQHSALYFPGEEVAVKTGSTQSFRDAWCIGYTSSMVVGVWVGNNDNTPMHNAPGVNVAAPIWRAFMEEAI